MKQITKKVIIFLCFFQLLMFIQTVPGFAQQKVEGAETSYIRIGSLQSLFSAYGSERAWNNSYYEGLIWPADYYYQDNSVIKRAWIAADNFTDAGGVNWEKYGIYISLSYEGNSLFPVELKQTAKFAPPIIYVNGIDITAPYAGEVDEIDPDQIPDRIITNVVNTSMGLTMTRRILAFSQQYHDNYFIKEFTFTNTGNVDYDEEIELNAPLKGVRVGWGIRYAVSREGSFKIGGTQSWGQHTWVSKRGEDYPRHVGEIITENPIVDWIRCGICWAGQKATNAFDNIGGPDVNFDGRLCAPHHAGIAILHVDKSATDKSDDPNQPVVLGWHAGDTYPSVGSMSTDDMTGMIQLYNMLSGSPYKGLGGTDRMDETYNAYKFPGPDPSTIHNDGGGTNLWICYGPFDLNPGESVTIVEAEGVNGLSRPLCEEIGKRWKQAYDDPNDKGPFTLPDGSTTTEKDVYKNEWVYTGKDSLLLTFGRAKRNFDMDYKIPQPPLPPPIVEVNSGGDQIGISWTPSSSESEPGFAGYKIYRAIGKVDTVFDHIATVDPGVTSYADLTAIRGRAYYYYLVAYNDGSNNTGEANPAGPLHSNRFYTRTNEPANLLRQAGGSLDQIRVVPNPYNIRLSSAKGFHFEGEPNKVMFLNIPGYCTIRIFTERGDLINTIVHNNGSGDEAWNLVTSSRQTIVSGIYIVHFTVDKDFVDPKTNATIKKGVTEMRKLVVIR